MSSSSGHSLQTSHCFRSIRPNPYVTFANLDHQLNEGRRALLECAHKASESQVAHLADVYRKLRIYDAPPAFNANVDQAYCGAVRKSAMLMHPDVISQALLALPVIYRDGEAVYMRRVFMDQTMSELTQTLMLHGWGLKYSGDDDAYELDEIVHDFRSGHGRMRIVYLALLYERAHAARAHQVLLVLYKQFATPGGQVYVSYVDPNAQRIQHLEVAISKVARGLGVIFQAPFGSEQDRRMVYRRFLQSHDHASKLDRAGYCVLRACILSELLARFENAYPKDRPLPYASTMLLHIARQMPTAYDLHKKLILDYFFSRLLEVHVLIKRVNPEAYREIEDKIARYVAHMDARRFIKAIKHRMHGGAFKRMQEAIQDLAYVPRDVKEYAPVTFLNTTFLLGDRKPTNFTNKRKP